MDGIINVIMVALKKKQELEIIAGGMACARQLSPPPPPLRSFVIMDYLFIEVCTVKSYCLGRWTGESFQLCAPNLRRIVCLFILFSVII